MNWKKLLLRVLLYPPVIFATILFSRIGHHRTNDFLFIALYSVSLALGWIGFDEIDKSKMAGVRLILMDIYFIGVVINIAIFSIVIFVRTTFFDSVIPFLFYFFLVVTAIPFPVALYVNLHQNKPISQSLSTDAS
jgi:hypothetical protein